MKKKIIALKILGFLTCFLSTWGFSIVDASKYELQMRFTIGILVCFVIHIFVTNILSREINSIEKNDEED